jgi:hypothetical protein
MELLEQLRKDPQLYYAYQANIAMAFKDNVHWAADLIITGDSKIYQMTPDQLHTITNDAAKYFLDLLIKPIENEKP